MKKWELGAIVQFCEETWDRPLFINGAKGNSFLKIWLNIFGFDVRSKTIPMHFYRFIECYLTTKFNEHLLGKQTYSRNIIENGANDDKFCVLSKSPFLGAHKSNVYGTFLLKFSCSDQVYKVYIRWAVHHLVNYFCGAYQNLYQGFSMARMGGIVFVPSTKPIEAIAKPMCGSSTSLVKLINCAVANAQA